MPKRLQKKINEKILNNIGKYKDPFFLTFSDSTVKYINSYRNSTRLCQPEGISFALEQAKL